MVLAGTEMTTSAAVKLSPVLTTSAAADLPMCIYRGLIV